VSDRAEASGRELDAELAELLEKVSAQYNFDFREYKEASLGRRIRARMTQAGAGSIAAYSRLLDENPDEHVALVNTILINVTSFFRDPDAWKKLAEEVIPRIVDDAGETRSLRIWSAGCSSGEEPYSLAILLAEHLGEGVNRYTIKIYGTDVDEDALTTARQAAYRTDQLNGVPDRLLERYFTRDGQSYRVRRDVRRWCIFGSHNVTQAPPLSHIDLLVCRNVLIYFTSELQDRVLNRFQYSLREDGFLFLGRSESLLARSRLFIPLDPKWRIFARAPAASRPATAAPAEPGPITLGTTPSRMEPNALTQSAVEALPAAVVVIDTADTILNWNVAAEALFGIPMSNALGRKFRDLDVSYRVEGLRAAIEDVKARHTSRRMEDISFTRYNGDLTHADALIRPLFDGSRLVGVVVYAIDATEHARLKEQLSRIAEQHATAIEELQSTNEELETTNEELQSTNEELETTNEELQSTNEELTTTVAELEAANSELVTLNTELERRGTELRRLDTYHLGLLNSLEQSVFVTDRSLVVTSWNHAAERMWGVRAEYAVGRDLRSIGAGDMPQRTASAFDSAVRRGAPVELADVPFTLPGGRVGRALVRIVPLRDGTGAISGMIAFAIAEGASTP
jgi:two-component system CheB/CheR fusion protein